MPRERSPNRDKAFEVFRENGGKIANREIASQLGIPEKTVGGWKAKDSWLARMNGVLQTKERSTPKHSGAPKGNQNAVGNRGGDGGPVGNDKAVTHGFFRKYFPDEIQGLIDDAASISQLDMLWVAIQTQFTAIIHAQKVMFVRDKDDETKVLKRVKESETSAEHEWEYQHAWDKQSNFLQAQSRAMKTLEGLISRYTELLPTSLKTEEHRLHLEKMKAEIAKISNKDNGEEQEDDGFIDALKAEAKEVWSDDSDSDSAPTEES